MQIAYDQSPKFQERLLKEERTHSERRPLRSSIRLKQMPETGSESLFAQGCFTIQDESSQLIGFLSQPQKGDCIIDACAGPGGKLSHIYELGNEDITLLAIEKDEQQLAKAKETMQRMQHSKLEWFHEDFLDFATEQPINKILIDAPCTGLGVLRRHPEGRWHKTADGIGPIATVQRKFLTKAVDLLKDGGEIIYSVCSFEPEECEMHLEWLQSQFAEKIEVISPVSRLPDYFKKYVTKRNCLSIYAGNQDGMDGFSAFIVKVR